MMPTLEEAKTKLDLIIGKSRVDLYKPIHIAEVLHRSRKVGDFDIAKLETFQNPSLRWRNEVTQKLAGKVSTSSARYQHDVWSETAMPIDFLVILDSKNKATNGAIEKYIYARYGERQGTVSSVISAIKEAQPETFKLENLLELFVKEAASEEALIKRMKLLFIVCLKR